MALASLASHYGVSADYLLGLVDDPAGRRDLATDEPRPCACGKPWTAASAASSSTPCACSSAPAPAHCGRGRRRGSGAMNRDMDLVYYITFVVIRY